jgi:signal transduction histidine kinase
MFTKTIIMRILRKLHLMALLSCVASSCFCQQKDVDSLLRILKKSQPDTTRLVNLSHLATAYIPVDAEKLYEYSLQLENLAEKTHRLKWKADAYNNLGISWGIRSRYDSSMYYFNLSLKQSNALKYEIGIANAYINIGQVFERLGDNVKASSYYLNALPLFQHSKHDYGANFCLANLGDIYASQKLYRIALNYYTRSLAGYTVSKKLSRQAFLLSSMASCFFGMRQIKNSLHYYELSFAIREKIGDLNGEANVYAGMASIYSSLKNHRLALSYLFKAKNILQKMRDRDYLSQIYTQIADDYLQQDYPDTAETFALGSLKIAQNIKSNPKIAEALIILAKIHFATKNYKEAYQYQSQYLLYRDSIFDEEKLKQLSLLSLEKSQEENFALNKDNQLKTVQIGKNQIKIQFYRIIIILSALVIILVASMAWFFHHSNKHKKSTNLLLEKQKEEISDFNEQLQTINEELNKQIQITLSQNTELERLNLMKSKLYAVISHDFRSPLSTLKSLIDLSQAGDIESAEMPDYLNQLSTMVDQTFIFLENLLIWSKTQMLGINILPVSFNIKEVIDENIALFEAQAKIKGIKLNMKVLNDISVFADVEMIKLIIRNLLANAIKFTGKDGSITVAAEIDSDKLIISIKDTGIGIDKNVLKKMFNENYTSKGTASEKGSGLGLMICKEFITLNDGAIWAESEPGKGSVFFVQIPKAKRKISH